MKVYVAISNDVDGRSFDDWLLGTVVSINLTLEGAKQALEANWSLGEGETIEYEPIMSIYDEPIGWVASLHEPGQESWEDEPIGGITVDELNA